MWERPQRTQKNKERACPVWVELSKGWRSDVCCQPLHLDFLFISHSLMQTEASGKYLWGQKHLHLKAPNHQQTIPKTQSGSCKEWDLSFWNCHSCMYLFGVQLSSGNKREWSHSQWQVSLRVMSGDSGPGSVLPIHPDALLLLIHWDMDRIPEGWPLSSLLFWLAVWLFL